MTTKIMVVEDESIVALNLQRRLIRLGYDVPWVATSHDQALQGVARTDPHLVLMDIHISGDIDGIDTAAKMNVPVIYLTACSEEKTLERAKATKPYGYLLKPFSERELHATIQMALQRHEVEQCLINRAQQLARAYATMEADKRAIEITDIDARAKLGVKKVHASLDDLVEMRTQELPRVPERLCGENCQGVRQRGAPRDARRLTEMDAERFLAVIESYVDAHLILHSVRDMAGRITDFRFEYVNEVAEVVLGIERPTTVGSLLSDRRSHGRIGVHFDAYVKVVETGKTLTEEFRIGGAKDWIYHEVVKFGDGVSIRSRDITERKHMQESLRQKDELLGQVADLSADYRTRSI
jgi:CheY-like chemotaxis protein